MGISETIRFFGKASLLEMLSLESFYFYYYFPFENPHATHSSRWLGDQFATFSLQTFRAGMMNNSAVWPSLLYSYPAPGLQPGGEMKAHQTLV